MVVAEILMASPESVFDIIADLFRMRLQSDPICEGHLIFDWHDVALSAKVVNLQYMKQLRQMSVFSVLYKLYSMVFSNL